MAALPWLGLIVFLAVTAAGAAFAGIRALGTWRAFKSFNSQAREGLMRTTYLLDAIEPRLQRVDETRTRLEEARARLDESLKEAAVLMRALGEARALVSRIASFVPR
jgi:hypothetical protein